MDMVDSEGVAGIERVGTGVIVGGSGAVIGLSAVANCGQVGSWSGML